jgi:hypothetical protein
VSSLDDSALLVVVAAFVLDPVGGEADSVDRVGIDERAEVEDE